jgi:flavodoxin
MDNLGTKKAVILYHSKTGTTGNYAREIGKYIETKGIIVQIASIQGYKHNPDILENADFVLLGCWTSGLMVILQHPEDVWKNFARVLPDMPEVKLALFTTYKILTGSMFRNMYKEVKGKFFEASLELKSRNGKLSAQDEVALDQYLGLYIYEK